MSVITIVAGDGGYRQGLVRDPGLHRSMFLVTDCR